jgi:serine/threonine protein kinase
MVSTISSVGLQGKPESLVVAMGDFTRGALSLKDIRQAIAEELSNNPSCGGFIHEMLAEELQARRLSPANHNELMASIDVALSENLPTETAEDAPSEPGIYHLDDEGTLVLSDDGKFFEAPIAAYDATSSPRKKSAGENAENSEQQENASKIKAGYVLRDRFRLDQEIARGSMGVVYKAVDLLKLDAGAADPCVAVKLISPEFSSHRSALKIFQNEIANTQHLSHPNIIHLFELDRDGDNYFITMEWLDGESLDALLDRSQGSALPPVQTYAIIEQLCDALAYSHERDVVHADVKPGNVFLVKTGELKLIDFGIARVGASLDDGKKNDGSLDVALTPAYASCERLEKAAPTAQDDLYALACMIYRLLSGRRVFGAMHALEAEKAGVEPVRIGGMSDDRWSALRQALSFRRPLRQASVDEFASKFSQRRMPRAIAPEPVEHADTCILESLSVDMLMSDTTSVEPLNEAAELQALAGFGDLQNTVQANAEASAEEEFPLHIDMQMLDEQIDSANVNDNVKHVDIARLEAKPDLEIFTPPTEIEEVSFVDTVNLGAAPVENEVPFVDTINLGAAPEPINIFDGDGSGFIPVADADPAAAISVPADDVPKKSAKAAPVAKVKQTKPAKPKAKPKAKAKAAKSEAAPAEEVMTGHKERVRHQLRGGGQRQVVGESRSLVAKVVAWPSDHPQMAVGTLLVVIVVMIGMGYMQSFTEPKAVARVAPVSQAKVPEQMVTPSPSADVEVGEAVMVDLSSPTVMENDDFAAVLVDLNVTVDAVDADEADDEFAEVPVELALPVGSVIAPLESAPPIVTTAALTQLTKKSPLELPVNARKALADGRLVQPDNNNASYWLEQMRSYGSDIPALIEIEANLANALIQRAEDAYIAGDIDEAQRWIDLAERNGAKEDELTPVRSAIAKMKLESAATLAVAQKQVSKGPEFVKGVASAGQVGVNSYPRVALSDFEFVTYVEPRYPLDKTGRSVSGWVDVTFIVGKDGRTRNVRVTGSDLPVRFEVPSIYAVKLWRFQPYASNGQVEEANSAVRLHYSK